MEIDYAFHHALEYHDRGWSVIPTRGKVPATLWKQFQTRRASTAQLRDWFGEGNVERYNVAILTGQTSGLVVIDCDSEEDASWWERSFPETPLVVQTGGGGRHFYYQASVRVGNRVRLFNRRIDLRGEGGLVVAPPSLHDRTGEPYRWQDEASFSLDTVPVFNAAWIQERRRTRLPTLARVNPGAIRNGEAYIRSIRAVSGQGGHNQTFRAACKLRDSGMSADQALEALKRWNQSNAEPPWSEDELLHKVNDAYQTSDRTIERTHLKERAIR